MEQVNADINAGLMRLGYSLADLIVLNQSAGRFQGMVERAQINSQPTIDAVSAQIAQAVASREDVLFAKLSNADNEIAVLRENYETRIEELKKGYEPLLAEQVANVASLDSRVDQLESDLKAMRTERNGLRNEIIRLEEFEELLETVTDQYAQYRQQESAILASGSSSDLQTVIAARQESEKFIGSGELATIFPGFSSRYRSSDKKMMDVGRDEGLSTALDILDGVFGQGSVAQQSRYIENELLAVRSSGDSILEAFLVELSSLVNE